jgi:hypothetical protein
MSIGSLHNDHITSLDALTGCVTVYSLAGILETYFKKLLELLLIHPLQPVIYFKLAAARTIITVQLTTFRTLYRTSSGAIIFF